MLLLLLLLGRNGGIIGAQNALSREGCYNGAMDIGLRKTIESIAGGRIVAVEALAGGMISQARKITLADGAALVAKIGDGSHDLRVEAFMLRYLRDKSDLPLPAVTHAEADLLLMEYIDGETALDDRSRQHLGELMAALHQITAATYGLHRDTLTGPVRQPNRRTPSWIAFFRDNRLLHSIAVARDSAHLPADMERRLRRMAERLDRWLVEPERPSLIHGDMWRANILTRDGRVVGIIDPALYYAHNEIELAYMTLFDGIGAAFFDAYARTQPIDADFFATRRHVYNLYPLLVHVAIFGARYLPHVDETLRRFRY